MNGIPPIVRYMIVCDDVLTSNQQSSKPVIVGLTTSIRASEYPFRLGRLCVFLIMTGGRGQGTGKVRFVDDATDELVSEFSHTITFPKNPLIISGLPWYLKDLRFPKAGMYRIEFCYNDQCLVQQLVELR